MPQPVQDAVARPASRKTRAVILTTPYYTEFPAPGGLFALGHAHEVLHEPELLPEEVLQILLIA